MDKKAMYRLSYGLFVITAKEGEKDNGCITNTAIQVTSEPNRISVAINKSNYTHDMIMNTKKFTVSVLSEKASFDLFKHFGFQSGRDVDKFDGFTACRRSSNDTMVVTEGTNAYISATVIQAIDLGSHTLFIADVTDGAVLSEDSSATYEFYQEHIKPKPEQTEKPKDGKKRWRCKVCGYVYEGDELPKDFTCPLCKHPASDFELIEE
ncbi:MAG: flavin reductase [Eubacterium sp.]|nr:flavin reductase [Eubacterium sp.]